MTTFINNKLLIDGMESVNKQDLDNKIASMLDEAISLMPKKGRAIKLYTGLDSKPVYPSFLVFEDGISKSWVEGRGPKLGPVTRWKDISPDEFLQWVAAQPDQVREKIYQNLQDYIGTETPKERGEVEFPEPEYLMGY